MSMPIESMLLAVNLNFLVFSVSLDDMMGQSFASLVPTVAAAESAIGLAIFGLLLLNITTGELPNTKRGRILKMILSLDFYQNTEAAYNIIRREEIKITIHQRLRELELQRVAGLFFLHFIVKSLSVKALCERNLSVEKILLPTRFNPFRLGGIHSLSMLLTHSFNAMSLKEIELSYQAGKKTPLITHTTQRSQFYFLLGIYFLDKELFTLFPKCVTDTNPYEQSFVSTTSHNLIQNLLIQAYIWGTVSGIGRFNDYLLTTIYLHLHNIASSTLLLFLTAKEISMVEIAGSEQIWLKESTHVERGDQLHATFASTHFLLFWHFLAFLGSTFLWFFLPEITNIFILWSIAFEKNFIYRKKDTFIITVTLILLDTNTNHKQAIAASFFFAFFNNANLPHSSSELKYKFLLIRPLFSFFYFTSLEEIGRKPIFGSLQPDPIQNRRIGTNPYSHKNSESRKVPNRLEILLLTSSFILNLLEYRLLRGFFLYAGIAQPSCHWKFATSLHLLAGTNLSCPSVESIDQYAYRDHLPVTFVVQNEAFNWLKRTAHNGDIIDIRMYNLPVLPPELRPIVYRSGDKLSIV
ncbi:hypothetical protein ACJX0J_001365, partial (mitochondrion) [Zea mays]